MSKNKMTALFLCLVICASVLFSGCSGAPTQDEEEYESIENITIVPTFTPEMNRTPTLAPTATSSAPYIKMSEVSVKDGLLSMSIPQSFEINKVAGPGYIFYAEDSTNSIDNYNEYTLYIVSFYQKEDVSFYPEYLDIYEYTAEALSEGPDCSIERIKENVNFGDGTGFISKISLDYSDKYTANIAGNDVYYKVIIYSDGISDDDEEIMINILESINLHGEKEKELADNFELNVTGGRYYSADKQGASVLCPDGWSPSESNVLSNTESILSLVSDDNMGTISVNCYPKSVYDFEDIDDFIVTNVFNTYQRGILEELDLDLVTRTFSDNTGRILYIYDTGLIFLHFFMEFEDAYYCIECMYAGDEENFYTMFRIAESFTAHEKEYFFQIED